MALKLKVVSSRDLLTASNPINVVQETKLKIVKYTLSVFLDRAKMIHGNNFDYAFETSYVNTYEFMM